MSFTSYFHFNEESWLPLPPTPHPTQQSPTATSNIKPETAREIEQRGIRTAISMLHSPELMIMLNPLVQHYSRVLHDEPADAARRVNLKLAHDFNLSLAKDHSVSSFADSKNGEFVHFEIIDKFQLLGGLTSKLLTYRACFRPLYDTSPDAPVGGAGRESIGLETISDPGNGVSLLGKWFVSVDETKPGFLKLTEQVQVHCNVFMSWFVRGQLETAHGQLHKEFGRRFCERMVEEDPMKGQDAKRGKTWVQAAGESKLQKVQSGGTGTGAGMGSAPSPEDGRAPGTGVSSATSPEGRRINRVGTDESKVSKLSDR